LTEQWLTELEHSLAADSGGEQLALALVVLAAVAGGEVPLTEDEARGTARRAVYLLAAGGDPSRGLDLDGRAVSAVAEELDSGERRARLAEGLEALRAQAGPLPHVGRVLAGLAAAPEILWRAYACSVLAAELDEEA
jgi:hypothetical protein